MFNLLTKILTGSKILYELHQCIKVGIIPNFYKPLREQIWRNTFLMSFLKFFDESLVSEFDYLYLPCTHRTTIWIWTSDSSACTYFGERHICRCNHAISLFIWPQVLAVFCFLLSWLLLNWLIHFIFFHFCNDKVIYWLSFFF